MVVELLGTVPVGQSSPFLRGLALALLGVGFWVGGVIVAHYAWQHYRGEE